MEKPLTRSPGILRTIRWCYRALIMLAAVAVTAGLASTAPAQAAQTAPRAPSTAALISALNHGATGRAATGVKETATIASNGDLTVNVDTGDTYDPATMQALLTEIKGENPHLSDTALRMFEAG